MEAGWVVLMGALFEFAPEELRGSDVVTGSVLVSVVEEEPNSFVKKDLMESRAAARRDFSVTGAVSAIPPSVVIVGSTACPELVEGSV